MAARRFLSTLSRRNINKQQPKANTYSTLNAPIYSHQVLPFQQVQQEARKHALTSFSLGLGLGVVGCVGLYTWDSYRSAQNMAVCSARIASSPLSSSTPTLATATATTLASASASAVAASTVTAASTANLTTGTFRPAYSLPSRISSSMDHSQFSSMMNSIGIVDSAVISSFFRYFERQDVGGIYGYIKSTDVASRLCSLHRADKIRLTFSVCDLNGDGNISREELDTLVSVLVKANGRHWYTAQEQEQEEAASAFSRAVVYDDTYERLSEGITAEIFADAKLNSRGELSFAEFERMFAEDTYATQALAVVLDKFAVQATAVMM